MTILNAWLSPARAIVAMDTLASRPRTLEPIEVSKFLPIPHCSAVVAGNGNLALTNRTHWELLQDLGDFDSMAAGFYDAAELALHEVAAQMARHGLTQNDLSLHQSIVLVGWSEQERQMRGFYLGKARDDMHYGVPQPIKPYLLSPDFEDGIYPDEPDSAGAMYEHAVKQVAWGQRKHPTLAIGGRLLIAEMTKDSMSVTSRNLPGGGHGGRSLRAAGKE